MDREPQREVVVRLEFLGDTALQDKDRGQRGCANAQADARLAN